MRESDRASWRTGYPGRRCDELAQPSGFTIAFIKDIACSRGATHCGLNEEF